MWVATSTGAISIDINTLDIGMAFNTNMGGETKGISADASGHIWVVNSIAFKVDPDTGTAVDFYNGLTSPYTYSDMTGYALGNVTCPPRGLIRNARVAVYRDMRVSRVLFACAVVGAAGCTELQGDFSSTNFCSETGGTEAVVALLRVDVREAGDDAFELTFSRVDDETHATRSEGLVLRQSRARDRTGRLQAPGGAVRTRPGEDPGRSQSVTSKAWSSR